MNQFLKTATLALALGTLGSAAAAAGSVDLSRYQRIGAYDLPIGSGANLLADEASAVTYNWDTKTYDIGNGFGHIAIAVPDAYKACDDITAKGGKVTRPAGPMKFGGGVIAFVEDPDGYKVELIQLSSRS